MIEFQCPKCQATLKAPADKIGARSKCRRCGCPLRVPDPDAPVAAYAVPIISDSLAPNSPPPVRATHAVVSDQENDSAGYLPEYSPRGGISFVQVLGKVFWAIDLITDVRFKRYLTPYIVRILWVWLLFVCFSWFFLSRFAMPVVEALSKHSRDATSANDKRREIDFDNSMFGRISEPPKKSNPLSDWLSGTLIYVVAAIFFLMVARVWAEMLIVVFNISNDLKEAKLRFEQMAKSSIETADARTTT